MKRKQSGQVVVEYALLLFVSMTMAVSLYHALNDYLIDNPDSLLNNYLGEFRQVFGGPGNSGLSSQYKYFSIRK